MTNKDKGLKLELMVASKLQEIFQETPPIRPTKASSGGSHNTEIADIQSQNIFVECKNDGNWFRRKIWAKLINALPFGTTKFPMYVINDPIEGMLIMLSFNDFCRLLERKR
jgi:hypothetical protein